MHSEKLRKNAHVLIIREMELQSLQLLLKRQLLPLSKLLLLSKLLPLSPHHQLKHQLLMLRLPLTKLLQMPEKQRLLQLRPPLSLPLLPESPLQLNPLPPVRKTKNQQLMLLKQSLTLLLEERNDQSDY